MKPPAGALLALATLTLGACTTLQNQSRVDPSIVAGYYQTASAPACELGKLPGDTRGGTLDLGCFKFPGEEDQLAYLKAEGDPTGVQRNRLESYLVARSDAICNIELGRLTGNEAMVHVGFNELVTLGTTVAGIVTGDLARKIANGVAQTATATGTNFDANVYRNVVSSAIVGVIMREHDRMRPLMDAKKALNLGDYSVEDMMDDVNQYYEVCSMYRGLQMLLHANEPTPPSATDLRAGIMASVHEFDSRADFINAELLRKDLSKEDRASLTQQLADVRKAQTDKIKELATVPAPATPKPQANAGGGPANPAPANPPAGAPANPPAANPPAVNPPAGKGQKKAG